MFVLEVKVNVSKSSIFICENQSNFETTVFYGFHDSDVTAADQGDCE